MPVPILRQDKLLIASLPPAATDRELSELLTELAEQVGRIGARGVVVDVSALDVLDSFATHVLETVGQVTQLRGAATVIVGIQPDVAVAMVQLGVRLDGVLTALDLEDGMELLHQEVDTAGRHDG